MRSSMKDHQNYSKILNTLMHSLKNEKVKYSYFVRSSVTELEELTKIFHLSEISEALQKDTGLNLNYNSFWQAYNRFKKIKPKTMDRIIIELPDQLKEAPFDSKIASIPSIEIPNNYDWLTKLSIHAKLKEMIIKLNMSEVDFLNAKINIYCLVTAVKQINEYMSDKNRSKKSAEFFNK